jgi:hypothetical protein
VPDAPQQIAFPPRVINGRILEVDQGDIDDIAGQVHLLCLTPQGWFAPPLEDLGLYDQAHLAGGADVQEIERQIGEYVPDAEAVVEEDPSALDVGLEVLGVRVGVGS